MRKFGYFVVVLGLTLPSLCADRTASVSGYVRSSAGVPQMGAVVEVLGSALHTFRVFSDENGFFSASGLAPDTYSVKVSAPAFLPSLREKIGLRAGKLTMVEKGSEASRISSFRFADFASSAAAIPATPAPTITRSRTSEPAAEPG